MPIKSHVDLFQVALLLAVITIPLNQVVHAQATQLQSIPPDSSRWEFEGQAKVTEYQNRKSLFLDGGSRAPERPATAGWDDRR